MDTKIIDTLLILLLGITTLLFFIGDQIMDITELQVIEDCITVAETNITKLSFSDYDFLQTIEEREMWEPLNAQDRARLERIAEELGVGF